MAGGVETNDSILRRFARDQWVRIHGTPRVTVLAGERALARRLWEDWVALRETSGTLLEGDVDEIVREAVAMALDAPAHPIAVLAAREAISAWRRGRSDRYSAMVDEGLVVVDAASTRAGEVAVPAGTRSAPLFDARSAAEAALFEALEATAATAGKFELNESLSVRFGPCAAEIDLFSRGDRIAIELDGFHHFADADCYRRDRRKDLLMQTQGLLVLRFLAEDVMKDPREAVGAVCQALAYRLAERREQR